MTQYKVYVDGTCFGRVFGWYEAKLLKAKLSRKYKNSKVWKEKVL